LEDQENSLMLKSHAQVKNGFKGRGRAMDFNVTESEKFSALASDSTLQVTFMKLPLGKFQYGSK
jgi:hypothetical protein